ncbi:sensor domain-containing phosphodiesterase [Sporosarcina sp. GW1-11]|uniref:sensor domain-containing phosphodiesterase n=1 Tax=Sporosarcina sp. GW1-11 TaxID=2899126 RepID=UPI00294C9434|nr:sensor domain-containing phosphodiesterase [Sporosarcina sp. GW1-11]MDV6377035.1 sensor domain-containing phosphodiesterase [Sporosarcina sp. GW1-11]
MQEYIRTIETLRKIDRIREQQEIVFEKAKYLAVNSATIKNLLENLCYEVSNIMKCERVSIWLFNEERTILRSQNTYDDETKEHTVDSDISDKMYATYFEAIQSQRTLAVVDIASDPATKEIAEKFFSNSKRYHSLLDACIILNSGIGGVLCCESVDRRQWNSFDRMIVAAIADMLSFLFDRLSRLTFEENLYRLAFIDELTGMKNYNAFLTQVESALSIVEEGYEGIFVYMNIDQFIEIHSVLGPEIADEIIKVVSERFQLTFEKPYYAARIAFDHFVIFLPHDEGGRGFKNKMDKLFKKLNEPIFVANQEVCLTYSYGLAYYPKDAQTPLKGVQVARFALEASKSLSSRKGIGIYDEDVHNSMKQSMRSEMNLRKALDRNEFRLFYQPQVHCDTGEVIGFEALIRWQHPERGLIYPNEFIELAESTGFIISIGEWVIVQALEQLKRFKELGKDELTISVNLSPRHFLQKNLPLYLQKCLENIQVDPKNLLLEITESVALERHEVVKKRIETLSEKGFTISIDDFGTGYSAFIYLQSFPITQLKIDMAFIKQIEYDDKSRAIVLAIIQLGKMLNIRTVAEGVETKEQWDILKGTGCNELQGFYFSKPLAEDELNEMLDHFKGRSSMLLPIE